MLDDFSLEQPIAYKIFINSKKKNKISHAYLIETNGYAKSLDFAISFCKYLFCKNDYTNSSKCKNCSQCNIIDKREFIELKIIEPDGQWIKKSQLDDLQKDFSTKSILGNKKIYIINNADRLNVFSSNSILKFLEEPEEGIIAILIVENRNQLLNTITSRCQILSLKNIPDNKNLSTVEKLAINSYISDNSSLQNITHVLEFVMYYEKNKNMALVYINKIWCDYFKERKQVYEAFTILSLIYIDVLNLKLNKPAKIFNEYANILNEIEKLNTIDMIMKKIDVVISLKEKIKFNINTNMLMDKLIIELERCV